MDVSALTINKSVSYGVNSQRTAKSATSFSGVGKVTTAMSHQIQTDGSLLGKLAMRLVSLGKNDGEILNSFVTFFGTAFIAPIFIYFNPFAKEDKETKAYSAWRQPISAILALVAQVGINKQFENYMNKRASLGDFDQADLRAKPVAKHLKRIISLQHGKLPKEQLAEAVSKMQDSAFRAEVARIKQEVKEGKLKITDDMLINKALVDDAKETVKDKFKTELAGMKKKDAQKFILEKAKLEVESNLKKKTNKVASIINNYAVNPFMTVDRAIKSAEKKLAKFTRKNNIQMVDLYADVINHLEDIKLLEKQKGLKSFKSVIRAPFNGTFNEILQNVRIKQFLDSKVANAEVVLKSNIKQWGIVVSLITLPVSCGLLNWVYPRVMEVIMPEASKKKNAKDAHALPQPQKAKEVKA